MQKFDAEHPATPHRVVVLLVPPVVGFDAAIPTIVFGDADDAAGEPLYEVKICGLGGDATPTVHDFGMTPGSEIDVLQRADTVIIPGTHNAAARKLGRLDDRTAEAFALIPEKARIVSLCTGAFVLAAAGMLDGRRATTHWRTAEQFRALYPAVQLDETALFVDEGTVLTSAGLTAGIDLCLHIVRQDAGWETANRAARYCVAPSWREGNQAQYIEQPQVDIPRASTTGVQRWALERLSDRLTVPDLAAQAHMSVRTFSRRFRAETGISPAAWLTQQRVRRAQQLLESTSIGIDEVASQAGFGTGAALRKQLRAIAGITPSAHRRQFGVHKRPAVSGDSHA